MIETLERPVYQLLPPLSNEEYEALKADIQERGVQVAVEFDENGAVLDGHHRLRACQELGIEDFPRLVRRGMTEQEKRQHVRAVNLLRRHLGKEQRDTLIEAALLDDPHKSNRQHAAELGVSHPTVATVRKEMEAGGKIYHLNETLGADGKTYRRPDSVLPPPAFDLEAEVERVTEALLREVVPPALEKALAGPLPDAPAPRPTPLPNYNLATEPPMMQAVNLSLSVERLAKHPMTAADFKAHAQPYTLARVREQIPAVIRLLQEIEKD